MAYEMKEGDISIFQNKKKTEEKHPSIKGSCLINGTECEISLWTKTDKNGSKFWQGKIKTKEENRSQAHAAKEQESPFDNEFPE